MLCYVCNAYLLGFGIYDTEDLWTTTLFILTVHGAWFGAQAQPLLHALKLSGLSVRLLSQPNLQTEQCRS